MSPVSDHSKRYGFTLIELMIVIGIVGILATIAIPTLIKFQLRAKAAEVKGNLAAIRVSEEAYFGEFGFFVSALAVPPAVGAVKVTWPLAPGTAHGFNTIGWNPTGNVYFQYAVATNGANSSFTAAGRSDIDGDGAYNTWGYVRPVEGTAGGVVGPFGTCQATGVQDGLKLVGPCDAASGRSEF
ncbi:MAG: type II secretion system protein [Myxococcota bacterium]